MGGTNAARRPGTVRQLFADGDPGPGQHRRQDSTRGDGQDNARNARDSHGDGSGHHHGHGHAHARDDPLLRRYGHPRFHSWISRRPATWWEKVKQFIWGFLFFEWYHELQHTRSRYNDIMNLVLFGELLGLPLMNSSIGLRLLPYVLPDLDAWKHRQLEEHVVEEHAPHIH
ncbi:hypothetical protein Tmar_2251 [Thermaerobacter marianensis DSM 12885]|uniref:Uncharacterized protein n=1 Tax=Thermaerobacter marianensis (strain ATCC 700841 / DSM 12885 / JCM 10246 / 7p75a) TaxID=644966 RepID=E6SKV6_THEM7|nr:hypothetical protein [Thermaerobacter marianensis]ADU52329.1 hypothetical protein Tmar_2251 [Thermaerobacter marianensis DSM 12885]